MRIKQISVYGLFGIFNHEIPLNMDDRITILHGPNGFGKTIILTMLNDFFHSRYFVFKKTPFSEFRIDFDNNSSIKIIKNIDDSENENEKNNLTLKFQENHSTPEEFTLNLNKRNSRFEIEKKLPIINILDDIIPELDRIGPRSWLYIPTGEELSLEDVLERFENVLPFEVSVKDEPDCDWLKNIKNNLDIRLIKSQRLLNFNVTESSSNYSRSTMRSTLSAYSHELAKLMQAKFSEYGTVSQSLDRSFPVRVVQQPSKDLREEKLREQLNELEKTRSRLIEVGLLNKEEDSDFPIQPETIDETTKNILSLYVEDVEKKLTVFNDIANKIELLRDIINKKFAYSYKKIIFNKEKGFVFTRVLNNSSIPEEKQLSPTDLSSGEQHELVLLYELLFKVKPKSLVLIDEPELSLHVGWQVNFLEDLQKIIELVDLDILMATHSPDIIQDRWDLTVELKGKEK